MLDLERVAGFPMVLGDNGLLAFGAGVTVEVQKVRLFDELAPVAMQPEVCRGWKDVAYYMHDHIYRDLDLPRLSPMRYRYELTYLPPRLMGREFVKTHGHRHAAEPNTGIDFIEVTEVLLGRAHFVLNTLDPSGPTASKAFYVEIGAGEKIVIPPGFYHVFTNPGPGPLIFGEVIPRSMSMRSDYDRLRTSRGMAYYNIDEGGKPVFVPNPAYKEVPPLRKVELREYPEFDLTRKEPLYTAYVRTRAERWPFLLDPREFWTCFPEWAAAFEL